MPPRCDVIRRDRRLMAVLGQPDRDIDQNLVLLRPGDVEQVIVAGVARPAGGRSAVCDRPESPPGW